MKYILLIMTFFCTGLVAQKNQQQHVDSLRKVISQFEGEQKISEYRKLIGRYFDNTMDTVLFQLFDDLEAETKKLGDFDQQRIYKFHRLRMYHNRYMFDKIVETAPKYLEFFRHHEKEDHIDYFNIYYMLIKSYIYTHDIETAIAETEQMYKQANAMQNKAGMAISLYTMSDIYEAQLRTEDQEKALREAIDLFENVDDINLFSLFANAYMSLCNMLISDKRLNEALEMMHKYEKLIRHAEAPRFNVWELNLIYHIQTGEYDKAEMYCDTLDNVLPLQVWQTNGSIHKIKIYAGRGQYDEALKMADKAMELAAVDQQRLNEIRRLKMDILAKTGQADELLKLALYTIDTNDSLYRKDIAYQIDELRTKYDVDKQDREMKYMWRYLYILGIVLIIILLLWRWHSWIVNRKNRSLMQQIREMDMLFAERELDTPVISEMNEGKDNKGDTLFARLNRLIKEKRIFAQQDASRVYVAEQLGVSDRTLYRCIKSNTNLTFSDYLAYMRLAYARELLANSENKFTMEKIAMDAGFRSTTTFYRQFKDKYDITPDEFRKLSSKFYPQITVDEQT